jgi:hypothetical protein
LGIFVKIKEVVPIVELLLSTANVMYKYASGHPGGKVEDRLGQGCKLVYFQTKNPKFW